VDVKYKSSMPSTGVRRGTETFRALVADVPVIGRVAEQISGEVIVVVSGRAYTIR
jgi:3-hydroxyisobutyrate dehydrogenase-like beta-hydroxyacid dehydrogenase